MLRKKIIGLLLLATGWTACTQNFDEINTDPNRLEKIDPSTLMTPTLYDLANFNYNRAHSFTHHLMQFMVTTRSTSLCGFTECRKFYLEYLLSPADQYQRNV